jgi:hypothetical protein
VTKLKPVGPNGERIVGVIESVLGCANVQCVHLNDKGEREIEYAGGTKIFWDTQQPLDDERGRLWIDENGVEWPESDLKWEEVK